MANFSEMSGLKQWAVLLGVGAVITVGLYFTMFKSQQEENAKEHTKGREHRQDAEAEHPVAE